LAQHFNDATEKLIGPQFPIDLRQCRTIRAGPYIRSPRKGRAVLTEPTSS
jgi:hypothetical protein